MCLSLERAKCSGKFVFFVAFGCMFFEVWCGDEEWVVMRCGVVRSGVEIVRKDSGGCLWDWRVVSLQLLIEDKRVGWVAEQQDASHEA